MCASALTFSLELIAPERRRDVILEIGANAIATPST
jgi:hypothetical protein